MGFSFVSKTVIAQADTIVNSYNSRLSGASKKFSFVHISDVHIGESMGDYGSVGFDDFPHKSFTGYSVQRLKKAVEWINENAKKLDIHFVAVTGDLTDSGERSEFMKCKELLDMLTVPYIPLIGNHDVWPYISEEIESSHPNGDSVLNEIFSETFDNLKTFFQNWNDGTKNTRIFNPETKSYNYLQNFSFQYKDHVFIFGDFSSRYHATYPPGPGIGPQANLMDFEGGSWDWWKREIQQHSSKKKNNVFLFSHHPPTKDPWAFVNSFSFREYRKITRFLHHHKHQLAAWFAGHIHRDKVYGVSKWNKNSQVIWGVETAANKDFEHGHFRIIEVYGK